MEISEILLNLVDRSTIKVRKAAKKLRKYYVKEACPILLEAYKREIKRGSWETQNELIITAGILQCNEFIPYLENICQKNEAHDMVTINTGCSYLRIVRNNLSDVSSIFKYSDGINYSLGKGFLFALGLDKMVPNIDDQEKLISIFYDFGQNRDPLYSDPRYGLAVACAGWKSSKVEGFLNHCKKTGDKYLISVSESSLKGEYVKKHIYGIYQPEVVQFGSIDYSIRKLKKVTELGLAPFTFEYIETLKMDDMQKYFLHIVYSKLPKHIEL